MVAASKLQHLVGTPLQSRYSISAPQFFRKLKLFKMADLNLQEIHDFMISIAKQAGERIVSATPTTEAAGSKKNCKYRAA
jgi:hypothetical protein